MIGQNKFARFRNQFKDAEWSKLNSHIDFKEALAADDLDKAGLLADRILIGETKSIGEARKIKGLHDVFNRFTD